MQSLTRNKNISCTSKQITVNELRLVTDSACKSLDVSKTLNIKKYDSCFRSDCLPVIKKKSLFFLLSVRKPLFFATLAEGFHLQPCPNQTLKEVKKQK